MGRKGGWRAKGRGLGTMQNPLGRTFRPEGGYLRRWQSACERSEAGRAAGCCERGTAAGARGAGMAWPCAW